MKLYCVECEEIVEAELTNGKEIYPHREDLFDKSFYKCPKCKNYVGCHPNSKKPLGCIPNEKLRIARSFLHEKLDPLWRKNAFGKNRSWWYRKIAEELKIKEYHTGWTKSVEDCRDVWIAIDNIVKDMFKKMTEI